VNSRVGLRARAVVALVALVALMAGGCMDDDKVVEWDLRRPTTPRELGDGARDLITADGPADFVIQLPTRSITGRYSSATAYAPAGNATSSDLPDDDPAFAIDEIDFSFGFTDDPDQIIANFERIQTDFDVEGENRTAIDAFVAEFGTLTRRSDGVIDIDDFAQEGGGHITELGVAGDDRSKVIVRFRAMGDGVATMTLNVRWDNGTIPDWE
jgi:hypothetical protein